MGRVKRWQVRILPVVVVAAAALALVAPPATAATAFPNSMAALGDSITRAYDVCCSYGDHPAQSWSTGNGTSDGVTSQYERLVARNPAISGHAYNDAVTGRKMSDGPRQASQAASQGAQYVTILLGANDLCTSSPGTMTPATTFRSEFQSTITALRQNPQIAHVFVSSIPNIYQLWSLLHTNLAARLVWAAANICPAMLSSFNSEYTRQQVVARESQFNQSLSSVCGQYPGYCRFDNYATYKYVFRTSDVSWLDYFHPSVSGQANLASLTWGASWWAGT
jgi:lysophospholipase L1-like esterase